MDRRTVSKFVKHALRSDGVFILRMISSHAGDLAATEITHALWKNFRDRVYKAPSLIVPDFKGPAQPEEAYLLIDPDKGHVIRNTAGEFLERLPPTSKGDKQREAGNNGAGRSRTPSYEQATATEAYQSSVWCHVIWVWKLIGYWI